MITLSLSDIIIRVLLGVLVGQLILAFFKYLDDNKY